MHAHTPCTASASPPRAGTAAYPRGTARNLPPHARGRTTVNKMHKKVAELEKKNAKLEQQLSGGGGRRGSATLSAATASAAASGAAAAGGMAAAVRDRVRRMSVTKRPTPAAPSTTPGEAGDDLAAAAAAFAKQYGNSAESGGAQEAAKPAPVKGRRRSILQRVGDAIGGTGPSASSGTAGAAVV